MSTLFSANMTRRTYSWPTWKEMYSAKGSNFQYEIGPETYIIWFYDGPEIVVTEIWLGTVPEGDNQEQNDTYKDDFEDNFMSNGNKPIVPKSSDGRQRLITEKSDLFRFTVYTHDWTDPTTWYQNSVKVTEETLTSQDQLVFPLAHDKVIDCCHGKITGEDDGLVDAEGNSYRIAITVDDEIKEEQDPHTGSGGDYTVNYSTGVVTFLDSVPNESTVKATYYYSTDSVFTIKPQSGKCISIESAEAQFSSDVEITDSIRYTVWGIADFFLTPEQMSQYGIPYGIGYKIQLTQTTFKTAMDYQNDSNRAYPVYPAFGGNGWRSQAQGIIVFDWDYAGETTLSSSKGMEIRVRLQHDVPFTGWSATATFYCFSKDE